MKTLLPRRSKPVAAMWQNDYRGVLQGVMKTTVASHSPPKASQATRHQGHRWTGTPSSVKEIHKSVAKDRSPKHSRTLEPSSQSAQKKTNQQTNKTPQNPHPPQNQTKRWSWYNRSCEVPWFILAGRLNNDCLSGPVFYYYLLSCKGPWRIDRKGARSG